MDRLAPPDGAREKKALLIPLVLSGIWMIAPGFAAWGSLDAAALLGTWRLEKAMHQGRELPRSNPDLQIFYAFQIDGTDRLIWTYHSRGVSCERRGLFSLQGDWLIDKITWVNPANAPECAQDPDMQAGRQTMTPARLENGELHLSVAVGDDTLIYVWRKTDDPGPNQPPEPALTPGAEPAPELTPTERPH